jgi:outer membrane protein assembly factor BamB
MADDWPQWMGPNRDGVWRESGIMTKFPAGGPRVVWRQPIGGGFSSPAIVGERLYVMDRQLAKGAVLPKGEFSKGEIPGTERVMCLDTAQGKIKWIHEYDCSYTKISYVSGPRTTPIVSGDRVFTLGTMGDLLALEAATGKVVWKKSLSKEYKTDVPLWGYAAHPLIVGSQIICLVGGEGTSVVSFDIKSGKELWRSLATAEIAYSPPTLIEDGGKKQLIAWLSETLNGLDPDNGKPLWMVPYPEDGKPTRPSVNITAPRLIGDVLYVTSFYHGHMAVRLSGDKPKVLYRGKDKNAAKSKELHTIMSTPAVIDGHIYCIGPMGAVACFKPETGQQLWESLEALGGNEAQFGHAFFVPHAENCFLFTDLGDLILAKLTPKGYQELTRANLIAPTQFARGRTVVWCHPAFAGKRVYVRNDKEIVCFSLEATPGI